MTRSCVLIIHEMTMQTQMFALCIVFFSVRTSRRNSPRFRRHFARFVWWLHCAAAYETGEGCGAESGLQCGRGLEVLDERQGASFQQLTLARNYMSGLGSWQFFCGNFFGVCSTGWSKKVSHYTELPINRTNTLPMGYGLRQIKVSVNNYKY